jgi:outer membrane biosynthesis protein TonB
MTGVRQLALVVALALASFGALFAVARASGDSDDPPAKPAKTLSAPDVAEPATVNVANLGKATPLPAMRRKPAPPPPVVVEEPDEDILEPEPDPVPTYTPPPTPTPTPTPTPQPSNPSPPSNPGQSFDDSG